ncbi:hypothetical protein M9H77_29534 [Catharanthus roseus]|uniref:Uncharacterized protein n=1 Tax=Catharanthus roseus TaxID=4058 RepID=A0ACB9ZUN2_CATRO|nr:hypothetical protein M9H77_29534 [Catharanthus roseus]
MSYSLSPPRSNDGSAGKEDADSTGGIGVGDAAAGKLLPTKVPIPPVTAGASLCGSGVISDSDVGSLGSSSIYIPSPIPGTTGAISGPSTDSSSKISITGIGSLSGTISLKKYDDNDDDDDVVMLGSSTRVPSLVSSAAGKSERIKTHQRSFYAPNLKEYVIQQWGSTDKVRIHKTRPSEPSSGIS